MTLIRALAAAGLGIQVVAALPSPIHHVGVDVTLVPDLDAPIGEARDAADRISIMGPVGLSAVDLGIIGSKGAYQATMLNIGDQGITVDFKTGSTETQEPVRKVISPLLDGLCSANTNSEPCAKKTSEIEIEAFRAVHSNHEVTIFTLKLARLDNKKVDPLMIAQFAFDGAETGSLIFLTDVPAPPPHHMPPPPPPCDTILCRVGEFLEHLNPFASENEFSDPGDRHHSHHGPHDMSGPHMHDGRPGSPGLGMRPGSYGMHHGPKPQGHEGHHHYGDYHHGPEGASRPDGEFPSEDDSFHPPPPFDGEPPENDGHRHPHLPHGHPPHGHPPHGHPPHGHPPHGHPPHGPPHHGPHPNGTEPFPSPPYHDEPPKDGNFPPPPGTVHGFHHGPHHYGPHDGRPFPLILVNSIFSILGFLVSIKYVVSQVMTYVHERRRGGLLLEFHLESATPQFSNDTKETSNLLADQAPPPVYRGKEPNVDEN